MDQACLIRVVGKRHAYGEEKVRVPSDSNLLELTWKGLQNYLMFMTLPPNFDTNPSYLITHMRSGKRISSKRSGQISKDLTLEQMGIEDGDVIQIFVM